MNSSHSVILSHPTGTPFAEQVAIGLSEAALLHKVITSYLFREDSVLARVLRIIPCGVRQRLLRELKRREWISDLSLPVEMHPAREIVRMVLTKSGLGRRIGMRSHALVDWVYRDLDRKVARSIATDDRIAAVYAYEDGADESFMAAQKRGALCFYDLPIMYWKEAAAIQKAEAERFPEFAEALQASREPPEKIERKEREILQADHIFVASSVTKRSLTKHDVSAEKITVIPYGAPLEYFKPLEKRNNKVQFLFVGRIGPRKGVHHLIRAWNDLKLSHAELTLIGVNEFPEQWFKQHAGTVRCLPSLPHRELPELVARADVLLLPSLVEGFGMVLLEAMACGVPIIASQNTAAPDLISEGVEGFVIAPGDIGGLKERILWCCDHRSELQEMGIQALNTARKYTWEGYRRKVAGTIKGLLTPNDLSA